MENEAAVSVTQAIETAKRVIESVSLDNSNPVTTCVAVDNVNHPQHYQSKNGLEVIDVIEAFTDDLKGVEAIYSANALKYLCRWKKEKWRRRFKEECMVY